MTDNPFPKLPHKDLISASKLSPSEVSSIFDTASQLKAGRDVHTKVLENKRVAMIFEKDSLRTRFTFDIGILDCVCVFKCFTGHGDAVAADHSADAASCDGGRQSRK